MWHPPATPVSNNDRDAYPGAVPDALSAYATLKHLAAELADNHEIAKEQAEAVLAIWWR